VVLERLLIQNEGVRHLTLGLAVVGSLVALLSAGCAHREDVHVAAPQRGDMATPSTPEQQERDQREVIAVENQPPVQAAPPARPRLSQTITLGEQSYAPQAPAPGQPQTGGPSVVVNNYNVQQGGAPGYYGYGYGGYGGYGSSFYGSRPTTFYDRGGVGGGSRGVPQWGATGWEGARRTAAPGQTPGVGGNYAPVPSYGPAQMK
jgi:hypothetical protein